MSELYKEARSSFALVCETLRYMSLLCELLATLPECHKALEMPKDAKEPSALVFVALYDLLFWSAKDTGWWIRDKGVLAAQDGIPRVLARLKISQCGASNEALLPPENRQQHLALPSLHLLVLPSGTELHEHDMVVSGKIVLQDKASCFRLLCYMESTLMQRTNRATNKMAMERMTLLESDECLLLTRSVKRLELLKRRMELAGAAARVQAELQSFLEVPVDNEMYRNVRSILLDPSCSGSGMTNRLDHLLDIASARDTVLDSGYEEETAKRLQSLADFQLKALRKAFSFPQVERVVYSTCSIFQQEDEEVVAAALQSEENIHAARPFVLQPALKSWPRRGLEVAGLSAEQAMALVRANGLEDSTNGFFVAYFERTDNVVGASIPVKDQSEKTTKKPAAASVQGTATSPTSSAKAEILHTGKKRKVLSTTQKEKRKRRKREKRKKHGSSVFDKTLEDEVE
ncbi:unnamed protein product [Peronospora destructor]|uniref:SAM-dependent MTase RsmB/NOP-type domain-containing protein n=1 Tax=Peronospora destructor TaxID=86335 RepID=A0AAV0UDP2_9STRA|nr:unnamed protein product [Peronospora destructor]